MRFRKWFLERLLLFGSGFRPNYKIIRLKPFLRAMDKAFRSWEELESDLRMKIRVRALRNIIMWLCSVDGAYWWRAKMFYILLKLYCKEERVNERHIWD
ncbi:MAG: hypothetical protein QW175_07855 [Candidatus Bathyarchaeia archaeon]